MEIGFNAGHSAEMFLQSNPQVQVTSFDLGCHAYVPAAKHYLDMTYPTRHTLIVGDSVETVPEYIRRYPTAQFDVIFIDGGHQDPIPMTDLVNCRRLARQHTTVIMDDVVYRPDWAAHWTVGPTSAWREQIAKGHIQEDGHQEYRPGRGMSWGKYTVSPKETPVGE